MDVDAAGRDGNKRVFYRLGAATEKPPKVCFHWRAGRCNRHPCQFLHGELPQAGSNGMPSKRPHGSADFTASSSMQRRPNPNLHLASNWGRNHGNGGAGVARVPRKTQDKLEGHQKVISGIALPSGSDKLYSGSKDQSIRVWDCQSGQCTSVFNLGVEIGCMISEGPWLFVGIPNAVKYGTHKLPVRIVLADLLDRFMPWLWEMRCFLSELRMVIYWHGSLVLQTTAFYQLHHFRVSLPVVSFVVGANRLYSGSMDHTIRVWEVMWADQATIRAGIGKAAWGRIRQRPSPTDDLLLYAIAACVPQRRKLIIEKYSSMDEIIRECSSMAGQLDVWKLLDDAHALVVTLHDKI